jgi:hypothetical protein
LLVEQKLLLDNIPDGAIIYSAEDNGQETGNEVNENA